VVRRPRARRPSPPSSRGSSSRSRWGDRPPGRDPPRNGGSAAFSARCSPPSWETTSGASSTETPDQQTTHIGAERSCSSSARPHRASSGGSTRTLSSGVRLRDAPRVPRADERSLSMRLRLSDRSIRPSGPATGRRGQGRRRRRRSRSSALTPPGLLHPPSTPPSARGAGLCSTVPGPEEALVRGPFVPRQGARREHTGSEDAVPAGLSRTLV
jgi:hypothetical protein